MLEVTAFSFVETVVFTGAFAPPLTTISFFPSLDKVFFVREDAFALPANEIPYFLLFSIVLDEIFKFPLFAVIPDFLFFVILLLLTVPLEELENPIPFSLLLFTVIFLAVKLLAVTEIPFFLLLLTVPPVMVSTEALFIAIPLPLLFLISAEEILHPLDLSVRLIPWLLRIG